MTRILTPMWTLVARGGVALSLALLLGACGFSGGGGGGGGSSSGTVNTPGGQVQVALQGGTFVQGPTPQSVTPPQGFQAPHGGIAFTAQVAQGGSLTVTLTFPQAIPQEAVLKKYLNNAWRDILGVQLSGSTATYQVVDGGPLDADGQANGQVVDPVALLVSGSGGGSGTEPDFTWKIKSFSDPHTRSWKGLYVNGRYLFVSNYAAYYSPDGQEWKEAFSLSTPNTNPRVYAAHNGTVVVVVLDDDVQRYYFSGDGGLSWDRLPAPDELVPVSVAYGAGGFVMLASEPIWSDRPNRYYLYRSTDGRTWERVYTIDPSRAGQCRYVVFGDRFVVGCSAFFLVSDQGIGWQEVPIYWFYFSELDEVVAVGDTYIGTHYSGTALWLKFQNNPDEPFVGDLININTRRVDRLSSTGSEAFLVVGYEDGSVNLLRSTDGQNWQVACSANCPRGVVKGDKYVGFGDVHREVVQVWTSTNGSTWTPVVLGGFTGSYLPFFEENGVVYRWTGGGFLLSSDGGETWTYRAVDLTGYTSGFGPHGRLIRGGSRYVSVGYQSIAYSSDLFAGWAFGKDQSGNPLRLMERMQGVAYSAEQGRFVAVGSRGSVYVSDNGEHWQRVYQVPGENNLQGVIFAQGKFVAVGWTSPSTPSGVFLSEDGLTWRTATNAPALNAVVYAQNMFVGVGPGGVIAVSENGESWRIVQRVFTNPVEYRSLKAICYNASRGYFIAAGNDGGAGEVWVSVDGRNWVSRKRALSSDATSVLCLEDGHTLVGGSDGGRGTTVEKGYVNQ